MRLLLLAACLDELRRVEVSPGGSLSTPGAAPSAKELIPYQLFLTSKYSNMTLLPPDVRMNVEKLIGRNAGIKVVWFDDADCKTYLRKSSMHLLQVFLNSKFGPYRSDICRTAWLADHGGWYQDLDVELLTPFRNLARASSSFVSAWTEPDNGSQAVTDGAVGQDVLNAIIGVKPGSAVMHGALEWLKSKEAAAGCVTFSGAATCGTVALRRGLEQAYSGCARVGEATLAGGDSVTCGGEQVRMLVETDLAGSVDRAWAGNAALGWEVWSRVRSESLLHRKELRDEDHFRGLDYALVLPATSEGGGRLIGFSRLSSCVSWGCDQDPDEGTSNDGAESGPIQHRSTEPDPNPETQDPRIDPVWTKGPIEDAVPAFRRDFMDDPIDHR